MRLLGGVRAAAASATPKVPVSSLPTLVVMAGGQLGWSRAALLRLLLGMSLLVLPHIQARRLRFVTLVIRELVSKVLAKDGKGTGLLVDGGVGLVLGSGVPRRSCWFRGDDRLRAEVGPRLRIYVGPCVIGGGRVQVGS